MGSKRPRPLGVVAAGTLTGELLSEWGSSLKQVLPLPFSNTTLASAAVSHPNGSARGCHKDAHPFFLLWHPLSDVWWLPTNRDRLPTNRHRRAYWTLRVFFFHYGTPWAQPLFHKGLPQAVCTTDSIGGFWVGPESGWRVKLGVPCAKKRVKKF